MSPRFWGRLTCAAPVSGHHGATVAIDRRAHTLTVRRQRNGPRHGHRTIPGQPPASITTNPCEPTDRNKAGPTTNPLEVARSDPNHPTPTPKTVRGTNRAGLTPA